LQAATRGVGSAYPPDRLELVALKHERVLEAGVRAGDRWQRIRSYAVLAGSGGAGPKLREGDGQVPEGLYRLTTFNPRSRHHLSVRVDYPNDDDRVAAAADGRTDPGSDIYIHGGATSVGCLAIGDEPMEELYVLLADVGLDRCRLILAPDSNPRAPESAPAWQHGLSARLARAIRDVRG
jgi:murein L,D-transpeptidase YafK